MLCTQRQRGALQFVELKCDWWDVANWSIAFGEWHHFSSPREADPEKNTFKKRSLISWSLGTFTVASARDGVLEAKCSNN